MGGMSGKMAHLSDALTVNPRCGEERPYIVQDVVLGVERRLTGFVGGGWAYVVAGVRAVCGPSPIDGLGTSHFSQLGRCACERHEAACNFNLDIMDTVAHKGYKTTWPCYHLIAHILNTLV